MHLSLCFFFKEYPFKQYKEISLERLFVPKYSETAKTDWK